MPSKSEFTKSSKTRRVTLSAKPSSPIIVPTSDDIVFYTINTSPVAQSAVDQYRLALTQLQPEPFVAPPSIVSLPVNIEAEISSAIGGNGVILAAPRIQLPAVIPNVAPVIATAAKPAAPNTANDRALARAAAAKAVAAFYSGRSLPFKAASELKRKSPINFALTRDPSERSAALLATILTYCDVQPGTLAFVRGSGSIPGKLLGFTGSDAERIFHAGPESGGLSNCLPDRVRYVSGPLAGPGAENAIFALNYNAVKSNLTAFNAKQPNGEHLFSAALGLLDILHNAPKA